MSGVVERDDAVLVAFQAKLPDLLPDLLEGRVDIKRSTPAPEEPSGTVGLIRGSEHRDLVAPGDQEQRELVHALLDSARRRQVSAAREEDPQRAQSRYSYSGWSASSTRSLLRTISMSAGV